jgi:hypothetical protein
LQSEIGRFIHLSPLSLLSISKKISSEGDLSE